MTRNELEFLITQLVVSCEKILYFDLDPEIIRHRILSLPLGVVVEMMKVFEITAD